MGSRRNAVLAVIAGVLAVGGLTAIAVALSGQVDAPLPDLYAAGPPVSSPPVSSPPVSSPPVSSSDALVMPPSPPLQIDIPAIGVHSDLQFLGLTDDNRLEVPAPGPRFDEAAWYKYSATPGAAGPAVILGHVDSGGYGPSVFFNLGSLQPGDEIRVIRADGLVAVFRVDEVARYHKEEFPTLLVYGETPNATLRLITCGGEFDRDTGHYLDNIIVFATLTGQA
jgi:Sortase domain